MSEKIAVLLFPTTLFKVKQLKELTKDIKKKVSIDYFLVEEPIYFGNREKKMNFSKLKLVLHRASMKYFQSYLQKNKISVDYQEFSKLLKDKNYKFLKSYDQIHCFDPIDRFYFQKLNRIAKNHQAEIIFHENPNFLTPTEDLNEYAKNKMKFYHSHFYEWQKKRMKILKGIKSKDTENRQPPTANLKSKIPKLPPNKDLKSKWVQEAQNYIDKHFPNNYGNTENFVFPVTHPTSERWFRHFLKHRFDQFGKYQDAMIPGEPFLFHSIITPMLNIGLLDPRWIIDQVTEYYKKNKISINNYEGYLRQVIGWREYSRLLYISAYKPIKTGNYFAHRRKLNKKWYSGTTGIEPIDDTIKMAFEYGYLHHILRLMMMSNFMNLCHLHPDQVYQWMMEFSCDSYDWVMTNNVYSMGLFADGGLTMRKPYLSSSNYILKMSQFKKDGHWEEVWDTLYYYFLFNQKKKLRKTAMVRNLHLWEKKSSQEQSQIKREAKKILKDLTD